MRNMNRSIIGHLNINSLRHKLESLQEQISENVDILLILETKLDKVFLMVSFGLKDIGLHTDLIEMRKGEGQCYI